MSFDPPSGDHRVLVSISDWEISCCVPPPGRGDVVEWSLVFRPVDDPDPHGFDRPDRRVHRWRVTHADDAVLLAAGAVRARGSSWPGAPAPPTNGPYEAAGVLFAGFHAGDARPDLPTVRGTVRRVWVATQRYSLRGEGRVWRPDPGTLQLREVERGPRWFDHVPLEPGAPARLDTGVLLELDIDPAGPDGPGTISGAGATD